MSQSEILICAHCATANRIPAERLNQRPLCGKCREPLFAGKPVIVDTPGFDRLIRLGTLPVLADFWAEWCGPCTIMAPQFEAAAATLEPSIRLVKVDIDAEPALAARYGIRSVPTVALFSSGKEVARQSGLMDRASLVRWAQGAS